MSARLSTVVLDIMISCGPRGQKQATMEVVAHDRLVADFEALECIRVRRQQRQQFGAVKDHLDDISGALAAEEAMERYMSKMPAAEQAHEKVSACWRALSEHEHFCKLTTPEKLQMINHRPLEPVAIHLMIEDCHRRFRDDRIVDDLIELLRKHLGGPPESKEEMECD